MSDSISVKSNLKLDILIKNGWVIDGTGNPMYPADIAIRGDHIVDVGNLCNAQANRVIDATGRLVCPGFIDAHSHTDKTILANPTAQSSIRQGITTEIVGHCGESFAPVTELSIKHSLLNTSEMALSSYNFGEFLDYLSTIGTSNNLSWFVGHSTIREIAGVSGSKVTTEQLSIMSKLVNEAMEAGALGISTGLEFEPGRSASTDEIKVLAKIVGSYGGYYASHIRNRDANVQQAVDEFIDIVKSSSAKGQISHLNIRYNTGAKEGAWQDVVNTMANARKDGYDILADMTPLTHGIGSATAILPEWVFSSGIENTVSILKDPNMRKRLRTECDRYWRFIHRGEWGRVSVQSNNAYPKINGMTFPDIAKLWGKDPWDCYFDILAANGQEMEGIVFVSELFTEEHLREAIGNPLFMLVVDGYSTSIEGELATKTRFPLHYMGMIHFLTHHVRKCHTLTLEDAIRKMTSMPATHFGLKDRGLVHAGYMADIVVFDYEKLHSESTIEKPLSYPIGIDFVIVNGTLVVENGEHNGMRPGRNLLRKN